MRPAHLALLALLAVVAPAAAQPDLDREYVAVLGAGDLDETDAEESGWSLAQRIRFTHDNNTTTDVAVNVPSGLALRGASCPATCPEPTAIDAVLVYRFGQETPTGEHELTVTHGADEVVGTAWFPRPQGVVLVHVPAGQEVGMPGQVERGDGLAWVEGDLPQPFHVVPTAAVAAPAPPEEGFGWLEFVVGVVAGAAIWAFLVARGSVQRRTRRQVAGPAAHAGLRGRPREELEARKRVLMAALKDLEKAKMEQQVETAVYDAVKADLKKQTVTVMRALEDAEAAT